MKVSAAEADCREVFVVLQVDVDDFVEGGDMSLPDLQVSIVLYISLCLGLFLSIVQKAEMNLINVNVVNWYQTSADIHLIDMY